MSRTELTKHYDELLDYLESEKKTLENKNSRSNESSQQNVESEHEVKKQESTNTTEELLKTCSQESEVVTPSETSKGFDVKKFEELMRSKLIDEHKRLQSYVRPYISVSEITNCLRKAYYYRKKYSINVKDAYKFAYLYLFNKVGNAVHDVVQDLYDFSEVEKTVLSESYGVKGRVDAIRMDHLYELKTTDPGKIRNLEGNYNQALIYSYILNTEYDYKINIITLVYIERNFRNIIVYDYNVDNEKAKKLMNNAIVLNKSLEQSKTPEPIMSDQEQCKYCSYKQYCKKDESEMNKPFEISEEKDEGKKKAKSDVKFLFGG